MFINKNIVPQMYIHMYNNSGENNIDKSLQNKIPNPYKGFWKIGDKKFF